MCLGLGIWILIVASSSFYENAIAKPLPVDVECLNGEHLSSLNLSRQESHCSDEINCNLESTGDNEHSVQCIGAVNSSDTVTETRLRIAGDFRSMTIVCTATFALDFEFDGTKPTEAIQVHHFKKLVSSTNDFIISNSTLFSCFGIEIQILSSIGLREFFQSKTNANTSISRDLIWSKPTGRYLIFDKNNHSRSKSFYMFIEGKMDQPAFVRNKNTSALLKFGGLMTVPCRPTNFDDNVSILVEMKDTLLENQLEVDNETLSYDPVNGFTFKISPDPNKVAIIGCRIEDVQQNVPKLRYNFTSGERILEHEPKRMTEVDGDHLDIHGNVQSSIRCEVGKLEGATFTGIQFENPTQSRLLEDFVYAEFVNSSYTVQIGHNLDSFHELAIRVEKPGIGVVLCQEGTEQVKYFKSLRYFAGLDNRVRLFISAKESQKLQLIADSPAENLLHISSTNNSAMYYIGQTYSFSCVIFTYLLVPPVIWYQRFLNKTLSLEYVDNALDYAGVSFFNLEVTNETWEIIVEASLWDRIEWKRMAFTLPPVEYGESPTIKTTDEEDIVIVRFWSRDENEVLHCEANGRPTPEIKWVKDNKVLRTNTTNSLDLVLQNVNFDHAGHYICTASNSFGSQSKIFIVEVYEQENIVKFLAGLGIPAVLFITATISCHVYLRFLRKQPIGLTEKEIEAFEDGDPEFVKEIEAMVPQAAWRMPYTRELEIPARDFEILNSEVLGSGQFGIVYKATVKNQLVAAKTLKSNADKTCLKGLLSELKIMNYIGTHEYVVRLVGSNTRKLREGQVYIFVELCELGSLENYLKKNRQTLVSNKGSVYDNIIQNDQFTIQQLYIWSYQIAQAMEFLASKNVIHGDLATRNVLLSSGFRVKLTDFGLSRQIYRYGKYVKQTNDPLPWRWMAIESLCDLVFSTQSDVWSFGVTLWEIFSLAEVPYPGMEWDLAFTQNLENGLRMLQPKYCTKSFYEQILLQCWHTDPECRPKFTFLSQYLSNLV